MFRLVKVLNGYNQCEVVKLNLGASATIEKGAAAVSTNGNAMSPSATAVPEYIALSSSKESTDKRIEAMIVTEEMVFKVEYVGTPNPVVGMAVGLTTLNAKMDAVTFNSNGKGTIIGIDDDKKFVYVRFRK